MKSFEMHMHRKPWGTSYQAERVRDAIRQFLNDEIYNFNPGRYVVEVRGYEMYFEVYKEVITETKISFNGRI